MNKRKKPVLTIAVVILLLIVLIVGLVTNLLFSMSKAPHLFGYYVTLQSDDSMEPEINKGTSVISKAISDSTALTTGTDVLCVLSDDTVTVRCISSIETAEDGTSNYVISATNASDDTTTELTSRSNILAVCSIKSDEIAAYINFARSFYGIAVLLILPCVILVIMLIVGISRASRDERYDDEDDFDDDYYSRARRRPASEEMFEDEDLDDNFDSEEFEDDYLDDVDDYNEYESVSKQPHPEFDSSKTTTFNAASELERKKNSIARNFKNKEVDENSPYQKAVERERTMQFRAQKDADFDSFDMSDPTPRRAASIPSNTVNNNAGFASHSASGAYPEVRDIKVKDYNTEYNTAHLGAHEKIEGEEDIQTEEPTRAIPTPRREHKTPNLDDILKSTSRDDSDYVRPSHDNINSIDELISVIENEKKKLK